MVNKFWVQYFFFIPRSIWISKAEGSGFLLAENANLAFNNISTPLIAELYLDFSFLVLFLVSSYWDLYTDTLTLGLLILKEI